MGYEYSEYGMPMGDDEEERKRREAAGQLPTSPVSPIAPTDYNQRIAKLESGGNPNIGFHDRNKGSAYGTYGMTTAAYQDARRANPSLPQDITQATPEQQTAAMNAYTAGNANQLKKYGIEATPANLANAHLLGATGLKRFNESGYLSPQAIAANGGEEKLRQIIAQRAAGQGGAASGAAQPAPTPAPEGPVSPQSMYSLGTGQGNQGIRMPGQQPTEAPTDQTALHQQSFQDNQNNPMAMLKMSQDENVPEYLRKRAGEQAYQTLHVENNLNKATQLLPTLTPKEAGDALQGKSKGGVGDWLQYLLLKHVGLSDLANEKADELGIGHKWERSTITGPDGQEQSVDVKLGAGGRVLSGVVSGSDTPLSADQLNLAASGIQSNNNSTLRTQANHAAVAEGDRMRTANAEAIKRNMQPVYTEAQIAQRQNEVHKQAMSIGRPGAYTPTQGAQPAAAPAVAAPTSAEAPSEEMSMFKDWNKPRVGEDTKAAGKRIAVGVDNIKSAGEALISGNTTVNDLKARDNQLASYAQQYAREKTGGSWNANDTKQANDTLKEFVKGDPAKMVRAHVLTANAFDAVEKAQAALQNGDTPLFNKMKNDYEKATGNPLPINAQTGATILSSEVMKSILPGGGALHDRLEAAHLLDTNLSPKQFQAATKMIKDFQGDALISLQNQWVSGGRKPDEFKARMLNSSPAARQLLDEANNKVGNGKTTAPANIQSAAEAEMRRRGLIK